MKHIIIIEEDDDGNLVMPLSDDILEESGWKIGDTLVCSETKNGSFLLSKKQKQETEWVLVEAVRTFRERYMVEVPIGKSDYALDTVTMNEAKEFSQKDIGEQIVSHRVLTEIEALDICNLDNEYCYSWSDEEKINCFFTRDGEKIEI